MMNQSDPSCPLAWAEAWPRPLGRRRGVVGGIILNLVGKWWLIVLFNQPHF
jgi:hypothetical protein